MRLIISLLAVLLSGNAWSSDTATFIKDCEGDDSISMVSCAAFYTGTVSASDLTVGVFESVGAKKMYCLPENFTVEIGIKIWQRYVEENPEFLTQPPFYSITLSLQDVYPPPCEGEVYDGS